MSTESLARPAEIDVSAALLDIMQRLRQKVDLRNYTLDSLRFEIRQVIVSRGKRAAADWANANAAFWLAEQALSRHDRACGCADKIHPCHLALVLTGAWEAADAECNELRRAYGLEAS